MVSEDSVVITAPSVEEAILLGLTRLTATRDQVEIDVLDEGSRGFLGIGAREARVRVTRVPMQRRRAPTPRTSPVEERAEPVPAKPIEPAPDESATQPEARPASSKATKPTSSEEGPATQQTRPRPQTAQPTPSDTERPEAAKTAPSPRSASQAEKAPRVPERADGLDRERLADIAREIARNLLQDLDVEVSIEWLDEDRPTLWISLEGRDANSLVGPRARNLHAVQYLFRSLIYHKLDGDYNVVVDADGYRKRKRRSLESLAESNAERAVEIERTVRLRAMPAHERRIVHITLRSDDRVTTESVGKGRDRAVTIIPTGSAGADRKSG